MGWGARHFLRSGSQTAQLASDAGDGQDNHHFIEKIVNYAMNTLGL